MTSTHTQPHGHSHTHWQRREQEKTWKTFDIKQSFALAISLYHHLHLVALFFLLAHNPPSNLLVVMAVFCYSTVRTACWLARLCSALVSTLVKIHSLFSMKSPQKLSNVVQCSYLQWLALLDIRFYLESVVCLCACLSAKQPVCQLACLLAWKRHTTKRVKTIQWIPHTHTCEHHYKAIGKKLQGQTGF